MRPASHQLTLALELSARYDAADFFATAGSVLAEDMLVKSELWSNNRLILWGEAGSGKTHLLHIWAASHQAVFINAPALRGLPASIMAPLVIDNCDLPADETLLLHLLNAAAEAGQPALLAARHPPARQGIALPDLSSRLRSSTIIEISPPTDSERAELLMRLAAKRQLVLPLAVQKYLLSRLPRTPAALIEAVTRLDKIALVNGGKITRRLAATVIIDIAAINQTEAEMLLNGHSQATTKLL